MSRQRQPSLGSGRRRTWLLSEGKRQATSVRLAGRSSQPAEVPERLLSNGYFETELGVPRVPLSAR